MKKLENINLEDINDLLSILKAGTSKLTYKHREEMIEVMKRADKAITLMLLMMVLKREGLFSRQETRKQKYIRQ